MKYDKKQIGSRLCETALCGFVSFFILRGMHSFGFLMRRFLMALCVTLSFGAMNFSYAALNINSVTLNGGASVTVAPGAAISAVVNETNTAASNWQSTRFTTSAGTTCIDTSNQNGNGTFNNIFNITAPATAGTYDAIFTASSNGSCGATLSSTFTLSNSIIVDGTRPYVTSINLTGSSPTNASSVQWTVIFSESVTGVTTGDFSLASTGLGGTRAISSVTGSGTTWIVTATAGTGSGTLGLNLVDDNSIQDIVGNTLGNSSGGTNGNFTGQVYTIDRIAPTVSSITLVGASPTNASSVQWLVTFSESVIGINAANFTLVKTGIAGTSVVTGVSGSGTSWTVTASTGTGSGTLGLNMTNSTGASDVAGNAVTGLTATGPVYTIDKTSPTVLSINIASFSPTSAASVQWTVTFSENVTGVVAGNFALINTGLTGSPAITALTGSGTTWLVTASTGSGDGSLGLNLTSVGSIADTLGNALSGVPFTGQIYTIDRTAPSACYTDDFSASLGTNWSANSVGTSTFVPKIVGTAGSTHLQLTDNSVGVSTSATLSRQFPGAGNKIVLEFDYFSYNGTGADGIAVTLSDALFAPVPGAFGGSLGYAQKGASPVSDCTQAGGCPGFNGGWLGVGLDEYGGFVANTEGRSGGTATSTGDVVTVRGSGSGQSGYNYHTNSGVLNPRLDSNTSTTAAPGHRYRITVDHSNGVNAYVTVDRDTTVAKTGYNNIIPTYDAKAMSGQAAVPSNWILSYTGSTGSNHNYHEIANLKICTTQGITTPVLNHVRIVYDANASTCASQTVTVRACADANCTALYLGSVAVGLTANNGATLSSSSLSFSGGETQVTLTKATAGTVTLGGTVTSPSGIATACYNGGTAGNCAITFSANSCAFDAVEVGKAAGTPIYTKIANVPFTVDVLSLATGIDARNATVDLVDQSGVAAGTCSSAALTGTSQTTTFPNTATRRRTLTFTSASAARDVRVRIQKTVNGATVSTSCSSDNFAIRPASFTVASTNASNVTNTGTPVFKAGAGTFQLDATSATGYTGKANINQNRIEAHAGAITAGSISGSFSAATLTTSSTTSWISSGTTFTYSEVGNFRFKPWGVYDDGSFANVDRQKSTPECRIDNKLGTNIDPGDPNVLDANGKYGCYFGGTNTSGGTITSPYFGRFIPDHFGVTAGAITNRTDLSCSSASIFTYIGEPMSATFTLTAQSAGGNATQNYSGDTTWAKLAPSAIVSSGSNPLGLGAVDNAVIRVPFPACGSVPAAPCVLPATASGSFDHGVASVILPFSVYRDVTTPSGPYSFFDVGAAPTDSDGVTLGTLGISDLDTVHVVAGANNHARIGSTDVRYGRLTLGNASGSELLNLPIKMRTEYWKTGIGFITNTDDSCSAFSTSKGILKNTLGGITPDGIASTATSIVFSNGTASIVLKKPSAATGKGSVDFCVDLDSSTQRDTTCTATAGANMPWLQGKWNGTAYDDDPSARATFGVFRSGPVIYLREIY